MNKKCKRKVNQLSLEQKCVYIQFFQNSSCCVTDKSHLADLTSVPIAANDDPVKLIFTLLNPIDQVHAFFDYKLKLQVFILKLKVFYLVLNVFCMVFQLWNGTVNDCKIFAKGKAKLVCFH